MTKELYNELMEKRVITDTKMTLNYINENKLKLEDIITVPAILSMYLGKEETVEDNVVEITEVDPPINESDVEETNDSDKSAEDTLIELVVDEVKTTEEVLIEEKPKTKKK